MTTVMRFTDEALRTLRGYADDNPAAWGDPAADFRAILERLGITDNCEPAQLTAPAPLAMPPVSEHPRSKGDRKALEFADNLHGLKPQHLADNNLLAYLSCTYLRDFAQTRWPTREITPGWVHRHFLSAGAGERTQWNLAGRLLWLAYTARRASAASAEAFTPRQALDWYCEHPEHYHTAVSYDVLASDLALAEYTYALLNGSAKYDSRGRILAGDLNRRAGAVIIDALPRAAIRATLEHTANRLQEQNAKKVVNVLSLGAGVQSTALALMAEHGYRGIPKPDLAIFADTGWEPKAVYEHLDWLESQLSYPVVRVSNGNIKDSILSGKNPDGRQFLDLPVYVIKPDGKQYIGTRQCTKQFKLKPIYRYLREQVIKVPKGRPVKDTEVKMWLGISTDESGRVKPAREPWITNSYPLLVEQISRLQLTRWLHKHYPDRHVPKSACIGCPYHSDAAWDDMKINDPESWNDAVGVDWALRNLPQAAGTIDGAAYLHRSRTPLTEVDFGNAATAAAAAEFLEECEGLCGI